MSLGYCKNTTWFQRVFIIYVSSRVKFFGDRKSNVPPCGSCEDDIDPLDSVEKLLTHTLWPALAVKIYNYIQPPQFRIQTVSDKWWTWWKHPMYSADHGKWAPCCTICCHSCHQLLLGVRMRSPKCLLMDNVRALIFQKTKNNSEFFKKVCHHIIDIFSMVSLRLW